MKFHTLLLLTAIMFSQFNIFSQWTYQPTPVNTTHYITIDFTNAITGAVGGANSTNEFFGRGAFTTNSGSNWLSSTLPDSTRVLVDIQFVNSTTGYCAAAYNTVTTNVTSGKIVYNKKTLQAIGQFSSGLGFNYKGLFLKTTNSGQSWFTFGVLPSNVYYMLGLSFINASTGFALVSYDVSGGVNSGVIKTTNGGQSWQILTMPENINDVTDIHFTDLNNGFVCGSDKVNDTNRAVMLKTINSGLSWNRTVFMGLREFTSVSFASSTTGLATSGDIGILTHLDLRVYKTTNAGGNWNNISTSPDVEAMAVRFFPGSGTALICGAKVFELEFKDFFSRTTDYGATWVSSSLNDTSMEIMDAELLSQTNWYMTGGDFSPAYRAVVLHTTNGGAIGISQISTEVKSQYSLSQNYPNPFNPSTRIRFAVPKGGTVQLKIYDMLGKEISMPVNQQITPGSYEVSLDALNIPSGVYFYKIISGDFIQTRRMVILK